MKGYVRCALVRPKKVDLGDVEKASVGAGYTLKTIELEATGEVLLHRCDECKKERWFFKLDPTGQMLEIYGKTEARRHVRIRGSLGRRPDGHVVLRLAGARQILERRSP